MPAVARRGRAALDAERLLDDGAARGEDRLLGEDGGELRRVLDEVEAPVAEACESTSSSGTSVPSPSATTLVVIPRSKARP